MSNETFCGYVGIITRSVIIQATDDTSDKSSDNYGQGAVINVYTNDVSNGHIDINNVQFMYMGNAYSDEGSIIFADTRTLIASEKTNNITMHHQIIRYSSFINTFDAVIDCHSQFLNSLIISHNIFINIWTGAVYIDTTCNNFDIKNNLVIGHYAPLRNYVFQEGISANHPIAAFTIFSDDGVFSGNKVAG
jgi:hypothetical protein